MYIYDVTFRLWVDVSTRQNSGHSATPSLFSKLFVPHAPMGLQRNTLRLARWRKPKAMGQ